MTDKKVAVIMSTYNGEKFIKEQMDSILEQTYKDIELIITSNMKHVYTNAFYGVTETINIYFVGSISDFNNIFKIVLPSLEANNPLVLSVGRLAMDLQRGKQIGPGLLNSPEALDLFYEMASAGGDRKKILWILEEKHKRRPSSFVVTRVLAAVYILSGSEAKALPLLEICAREKTLIYIKTVLVAIFIKFIIVIFLWTFSGVSESNPPNKLIIAIAESRIPKIKSTTTPAIYTDNLPLKGGNTDLNE